jgi:hypothetical protein
MRRVVAGKAGGIARKPTTGKTTSRAKPKSPIAMARGTNASTGATGAKYGKRAASKGFAKGMAKKAAGGKPAVRAPKANYGKSMAAKNRRGG